MRKQRIHTLHRKHTEAKPMPLFYRSKYDPKGKLRMLTEPETLIPRTYVKKHFRLEREDPYPPNMTVEQIANFVRQIGTPDPGKAVTKSVAGRVICTIPYETVTDRKSEYYGTGLKVPKIKMWRGYPL